jgi:hypothetical protein
LVNCRPGIAYKVPLGWKKFLIIDRTILCCLVLIRQCSQGLVFGYCFHPLTGQRFSGEHLGSLLAGTSILEKKKRVFLGVNFEVVMN